MFHFDNETESLIAYFYAWLEIISNENSVVLGTTEHGNTFK